MKKTLFIALISFLAGLLLAGMIFVYLPEKNQPESFADEPSSPALASPLYASHAADSPQIKPDLDFVSISEKVGPSVVQIVTEKVEKRRVLGLEDQWPLDDFWDKFFGIPREREREYRQEVKGTGFFISSDGYILTNNHMVENSVKTIIFSIQEKEYTAKIVGTDPLTDLALLKIDDKNLPFAELADSSQLQVGEWVLAIGNPWGLEHTVTAGIVSSKGRQLGIPGMPYQDFIQTDAAINPGNSGGPLVNMKGEVVGINSIIYSPQGSGGNIGIGFAIPSSIAKKVVSQLKENGKVIRGYLGVKAQLITSDDKNALKLKSNQGALLIEVEPDTPAEKAGLKRYDVITEINGQPVKDHNDLGFKIADFRPGTTIEIKVIRDGKEKSLTAKLVELQSEESQKTSTSSGKDLGLKWNTLTPRLAKRLGLQTQEGVLITEVRSYSEADKKGLQAGDIIIEANRERIRDAEQLQDLINKLNSGDAVILLVRRETSRGIETLVVTLRIP
jgi:serine protease Do